jgi:hypothetical protein
VSNSYSLAADTQDAKYDSYSPLRPETCQSVRMDFLALTPGVHAIDALTLTDVETGFAVNLK